MGLQDIDCLYRILDVPTVVDCLHSQHSVDSHWGKEIIIPVCFVSDESSQLTMDSPSDDLARHTRLRRVNERLPSKCIHLYAQLILHELACLPASQTIPSNDGSGVDLLLDELVRAAKKFCSDEHDRRRPISDFLVLLLGKIDKDASSGMFNSKEGKDGRAVIRYGHFLEGWNDCV